ncbi:hypothetical protein M758_2G137200 [Ceratodon purpureus]|nr:hypothetical protein M758_2G137200 [Ceratodon purpureus]
MSRRFGCFTERALNQTKIYPHRATLKHSILHITHVKKDVSLLWGVESQGPCMPHERFEGRDGSMWATGKEEDTISEPPKRPGVVHSAMLPTLTTQRRDVRQDVRLLDTEEVSLDRTRGR